MALFLLPPLVLALSLAAIVDLRGDRFVLIRTGSHEGPLPLLFWCAVLAYALSCAWLLGGRLSALLPAAMGLGFVSHVWLLLVQLQALSIAQPAFYDNRVYLFYFRAWLLAGAVAFGWSSGAVAGRLARGRRDLATLVWLALPAVWAVGLAGLLWSGGPTGLLAGAVSLAGFAAGAGLGHEPVLPLARWVRAKLERRNLPVDGVALAILGLAAFCLVASANYSLVVHLGDKFPLGTDDGDRYDEFSWLMATGGLVEGKYAVATRWYFRPPGYLFMISSIYRLFGHSYLAVGLVQALMSAFLPALTYALARRVFGRLAALLAALLVAFSGTIVGIMFALSSEALFIPQTLGLCYALLKARESPRNGARAGWLVLGGGLLGFAHLTRPQVLGLVPLGALWVVFFVRPSGSSWLPRLSDGAVLVAATLLVMTPALWHDYRVNGRVSLLTSGAQDAWVSDVGINPMPTRIMALGINPFAESSVKLQKLWQHRWQVARIVAEEVPPKAVRFFFGGWHGSADPFLLQRFSPYALNLRLYGYLMVVVGALVCLIQSRFRVEKLLIFGYFAYTVAVIMIGALPLTRYRVSLDPFLLILLAGGACWLGARAVRGTRGLAFPSPA